MARFFIPRAQFRDRRATISGNELEHLRRVLRYETGDRVIIFDDRGWEHQAVIRSLADSTGELEILESQQSRRESPLATTLAVGLTKGDKMDYVVEKATELGVHKVAPFFSRYTVPQLDERRAGRRQERWAKIALSAAKQCGRAQWPEVLPVRDYAEVIDDHSPADLKLLFWEKESQQTLRDVHSRAQSASSVIAVVGPEGGFSIEEAEAAAGRGYINVTLGPRILRAETAAIAIVSLIQYLWGDLS